MKRSDITPELERAAFDFHYWFARFEFCLKEGAYLKSDRPGKKAEPNWDKFVRSNRSGYAISADARALVNATPMQQVTASNSKLAWREIIFDENEYDLQKVAILLRTVRNNLFQGGKSGQNGWDDVEKTMKILAHAKVVLDELAELGGFSREYTRA